MKNKDFIIRLTSMQIGAITVYGKMYIDLNRRLICFTASRCLVPRCIKNTLSYIWKKLDKGVKPMIRDTIFVSNKVKTGKLINCIHHSFSLKNGKSMQKVDLVFKIS